MKLLAKTCTLRGSNAVRFVAVIPKSAKLGIKKRHQKTWSFPTVAPNFTLQEMRPSVEKEAERWEKKVMEANQPDKPPASCSQPALPVSAEPAAPRLDTLP